MSSQINLDDVEDLSQVCRICASQKDVLLTIFEKDGRKYSIAEIINTHLPIKVATNDVLPQQVCYPCCSTLLAWQELVECCLQADTLLRQKHTLAQHSQLSDGKIKTDNIIARDKVEQISSLNNDETEIKLGFIEESQNSTENKEILNQQNENTLPKPENVVTKDGKKYVVCDVCSKSVSSASWRRHRRSHETHKRYHCAACGLGFSDGGNLARHTRAKHSSLRPHACPLCSKTFSRNCHLQDHIKSHSENREFVCDVCGKASKSSAALRMHRKVHDSECRFQCVYCGARFKRRGQLVAHSSVHSGERAHRCVCGRSFRLRSQLTAHARTHDRMKEKFKE